MVPWTEAELAILAANADLTARALTELLPGRSGRAIGNMRLRHCGHRGRAIVAVPPARAPGDYVEILSAYLADEPGAMESWLHWNGYAGYRELNRSRLGWVTLLCTVRN